MAKTCAVCGKKSAMVWIRKKLRGKYNPTVKKRKYPNLQKLRVPFGIEKKKYKKFAGKQIIACAKCIKALGKKK